jgi:hypothetical protein
MGNCDRPQLEAPVSFTFKPAKREDVGLLIGLNGGTGSGKTYTGMRLASGIAAGRPFAVIDTEAGRAKHYADAFRFDHGDLKPPFRPDAYAEAIAAADAAGYPVIVVDSASHEWAGDGGILDWQEEEFQRMGARDAVKIASWIAPKIAHKKFVQRLLQVRAHLILCFRAEPKIEVAKENGKTVIREKETLTGYRGWVPISEKNLPFELTASFMFLADKPGVPLPIKLPEQLKPFIPLDKPITEESGAALAEWARGGQIDWIARIDGAQTKAELAAVGRQIALVKASLPESAQILITSAYKDRLEQFAPQLRERVQFSNDEKRIS